MAQDRIVIPESVKKRLGAQAGEGPAAEGQSDRWAPGRPINVPDSVRARIEARRPPPPAPPPPGLGERIATWASDKLKPGEKDAPPAADLVAFPMGRGLSDLMTGRAPVPDSRPLLERPLPADDPARIAHEQQQGSIAPRKMDEMRAEASRPPPRGARPFGAAQNIAQDIRESTKNPVLLGAVAGVSMLGKTGVGAVRLAADLVGAEDVSNFARGASMSAETIGTGATRDLTGNRKLVADVTNSILGSAPSLVVGMAGGPALKLLFAQSTLAEYNAGRDAGFDPGESLGRAGIMGFAEAFGERFGFGEQITLLKSVTKGLPQGEIAKVFGQMLTKEIPGEQLTTAMQTLADKIGPAALAPNASISDYLNAAGETLKVTIGQTAVMGGGPAVISSARNEMRRADALAAPQQTAADRAAGLASREIDSAADRYASYFTPQAAAPMPPTQAREASVKRFDELAAAFGLNPKAAAKVREQAGTMAAAEAPGFLARVTRILNQRGMFKRPVDDAGIGELGQVMDQVEAPEGEAQAPAAAPAPAAPPADEGDFTGLDAPEVAPATVDALAGEQINRNWTAFAPESGTLNLPREQLPQIKAEHRGALVQFMAARGVTSQPDEVPASDLKPTQGEFSPRKVKQAMEFTGGDRSILVSSDGYVLDGHHQWLAKLEAGAPVKIIRLGAPIQDLLRLAHQFPSSTTAPGPRRTQDEPVSNVAESAAVPSGPADGRSADAGRGVGNVGSDADASGGMDAAAAAPVPGSGTAVPVGERAGAGYSLKNGFIPAPNGYKVRISQHSLGSNVLDPTADAGAFVYEVRKGDDDANPLVMVVNKDGKLAPAKTAFDGNNRSSGAAWVPSNQSASAAVQALLEQRAGTGVGTAERKAIDAKIAEAVQSDQRQPPAGGSLKERVEAKKVGAAQVAPEAAAPAPRVIGRVGRTPKAAEDVDVRPNADGTLTPYMGGQPLLDYDSAEPIVVPAESTDREIADAIERAGAIGGKSKFYGVADDPAPSAAAPGTATPSAPPSAAAPGAAAPAQPAPFSEATDVQQEAPSAVDRMMGLKGYTQAESDALTTAGFKRSTARGNIGQWFINKDGKRVEVFKIGGQFFGSLKGANRDTASGTDLRAVLEAMSKAHPAFGIQVAAPSAAAPGTATPSAPPSAAAPGAAAPSTAPADESAPAPAAKFKPRAGDKLKLDGKDWTVDKVTPKAVTLTGADGKKKRIEPDSPTWKKLAEQNPPAPSQTLAEIVSSAPNAAATPAQPAVDAESAAPAPAAAPGAKPRLAEAPDTLLGKLKMLAGGYVDSGGGRGILPVYARNPAGGPTYAVGPGGKVTVIEDGGRATRDATAAEVNEFHNDLEADRLWVHAYSRWGGSGGDKATSSRPLVELHSPSGLSWKGQATPSPNRIFTEDAAEKARALLKRKLGQVNSGIDPEVLQAGITLAGLTPTAEAVGEFQPEAEPAALAQPAAEPENPNRTLSRAEYEAAVQERTSEFAIGPAGDNVPISFTQRKMATDRIPKRSKARFDIMATGSGAGRRYWVVPTYTEYLRRRGETEPAAASAAPEAQQAAPAPVSSREGQMNLANRGARIASLKAMNNRLRQIAPEQAWADSNIENASNAELDRLQDQISAALVEAQRGPAPVNPLRAELEAMSGTELRDLMGRMGLAGKLMTASERVDALLAEDPAEVRAAMQQAAPSAPAPEAEPAAQPQAAQEGEGRPSLAPMPAVAGIPREAAQNAHRGTSFVPEERAGQEQQSFMAALQDAWAKAARIAGQDEKARERITEVFRDVADGYRARYMRTLDASSRVMSSMIAGPARFPVERNRKRMETERKRADEAQQYLDRGIKRLIRAARGPIDNSPESELESIRLRLAEREEAQEAMKAANVALRKGDDAALEDLGFTAEQIAQLKKGDFAGRKGFPDYKLTNNNAEIRRLRERLTEAEARLAAAQAGPTETERAGVRIVEDAQDDRLRLIFDGKPSEEVREALKAAGFKWSPKSGAWQRQLTDNAKGAARRVLDRHFPATESGDRARSVDAPTDEAGNTPMLSRAAPAGGISHEAATDLAATIDAGAEPAKTQAAQEASGDGETPAFQRSATPYNVGDAGGARDDTRPGAVQAVGVLDRAIGRHVGDASVHPYVARFVPGDEAIRSVAAALGTRVQWFGLREVLTPAERRKFGFFNGVYYDGTIYLRDAGGDRPHLAVLGHELVHRMKATRPTLYKRFLEEVRPFVDQARYAEFVRTSSVVKDAKGADAIREEFLGEVMADAFMDRGFWRALADKNPSVFGRVVKMLHQLIDAVLKAVGYTPRTARILTDFRRVMDIAADVMAEYADAGGAAAASELRFAAVGAPTYFSALARAVDSANMKAAPAAGWQQWLKGLPQKGVKPDEIEWSGLPEWLDLQDGKVTREAVSEYLRANGVQIAETVLGAAGDRQFHQAMSDLYAWATAEANAGRETPMVGAVLSGEDIEAIQRQRRRIGVEGRAGELVDAALAAHRPRTDRVTKYGQYTLPGGTNYREILLTLPAKPDRLESAGRWAVVNERGDVLASFDSKDRAQRVYEAQGSIQGHRIEEVMHRYKDDGYRSSHWDQPNVLAHIRLNDRTDASGARVLFVEEIQSDFGQATKKQRDAIGKAVEADFNGIIERMKKAGVLTVDCD